MAPFALVPFVILSVALLIRAELVGKRQQYYVFKPLSTLLVIAVCALSLLRPQTQVGYTLGLLVGLFLSLGGDVALMFPSSRAFLLGVVLFLLAHVAYSVTFWLAADAGLLPWPVAALLALIVVGFYRYMAPSLCKMRLPVLVYAVVISIMVYIALGTLRSPVFSPTRSMLVALGAALFYLSDLLLALNKFKGPIPLGRLWSLSAYYGGQLLLALSAAFAVGGVV